MKYGHTSRGFAYDGKFSKSVFAVWFVLDIFSARRALDVLIFELFGQWTLVVGQMLCGVDVVLACSPQSAHAGVLVWPLVRTPA